MLGRWQDGVKRFDGWGVRQHFVLSCQGSPFTPSPSGRGLG
jgi:hypothetical protein